MVENSLLGCSSSGEPPGLRVFSDDAKTVKGTILVSCSWLQSPLR
ncbi:hypothetical protein [Paenibacillus anseongensis]|nr:MULTISPECIES: hypothetical protein [Paenibacillus]